LAYPFKANRIQQIDNTIVIGVNIHLSRLVSANKLPIVFTKKSNAKIHNTNRIIRDGIDAFK
jgi:hypothetical protein